MKISNLDIKAYGLFDDYPLSDLAEGLVVVYGANETGKTTLFSALTSLLYGFYPPSSNFPYLPWHTNKHPELQATILLKDGTVAEVMRRLAGNAQGTLTHGGHTSQIANQDLPFVQHVGMDLYTALYALMQSNMRSLKESEEREIEERLLGGMGADMLRPTRECIAELTDKASSLWRPDNRGRPIHKNLQRHLREIRTSHRQAIETDKAVRKQHAQLARVQEEIQRLRERKSQLTAQVRRADVLLPLRKKLQQIDDWNRQVNDLSAVDMLPDGIKAEYHRYCDAVKERQVAIARLRHDRENLEKTKEELTDEDRMLLAQADRLESWIRRFSGHEQERRNLDDLKRREIRLNEMLAETGQAFLSEPWRDNLLPNAESIILPDLKARILDYTERREEARQEAIACKNVAVIKLGEQLPRWAVVGACIVGSLMLTLGLLCSASWLVTIGIGLTLFGGFAFFYNSNLQQQRTLLEQRQEEQQSSLEKSLRGAESDAEKLRDLIAEVLRELPVASAILERPDLFLYQTVEKLRSQVTEYQRLLAERQERERDWDKQQENLKELTKELCEMDATSEALSCLEEKLETAKERRHDFQGAGKRIKQIDEALKLEQEQLKDAEEKRDGLIAQVVYIVGNDLNLENALQVSTELQVTAQKIHAAERQLEQEYPELPGLREEIRQLEGAGKEAWLLNSAEVELHRDEIDNIARRLEDHLIGEEVDLQKDIENARDSVSVGELEGEIAQIGEEMQDVRVCRDRLVLLSALLQEADRIFREKHQPDVLKRASKYLSKISGDRYTMLTRMTGDEGQGHLAVKTRAGGYIVVKPPLSSGILDQVYLAFRLAVIDHLDENHEPLPLFLDEALINWDDVRFDKGIEILRDVAQERQIFVFTCHGWIAKRLRDVGRASVHTLPVLESMELE